MARAASFQPYTHYCVGGNTKFWGSVLYRLRREDFGELRHRRRRVAGLADRLRHAGAVLRRAERLYACAAPRRGPHRTTARAVSASGRCPTRRRMAAIVERAAGRWACTRRRCRWACSGRASAGGCGSATPATRFRVSSTPRATPRCAGSVRRWRRPNVDVVDRQRWRGVCITDPRHAGRRRWKSNAMARSHRVEAGVVVVALRRGEFGGAAAAIGLRPASRRAWPIRRGWSAGATWRTWPR